MKTFILTAFFLLSASVLFSQEVPASPKTEFSIALSANALNVAPGESKDVSVYLLRSKGYKKLKATLGVASSLPEGITVTYIPEEGVIDNSVVTISVASTAKPGVYRIILNGTVNYKSKGASLKLIVGDATGQITTAN